MTDLYQASRQPRSTSCFVVQTLTSMTFGGRDIGELEQGVGDISESEEGEETIREMLCLGCQNFKAKQKNGCGVRCVERTKEPIVA